MDLPERYSRNIGALSIGECSLLASKRATVVGCGGLGGYCIESLARMGVGHLCVIDGDVFEKSNLNRQLLATEQTLGRSKARCAAERVAVVNPLIEVIAHDDYLSPDNAERLLAGADCVLDCLDGMQARQLMLRTCGELRIPLIHGAIAGWFGRVTTILPFDDDSALLSSDTGDDRGVETVLGNLPMTAQAIASFQCSEAVRILSGREPALHRRLLLIDLSDCSTELMDLA